MVSNGKLKGKHVERSSGELLMGRHLGVCKGDSLDD